MIHENLGNWSDQQNIDNRRYLLPAVPSCPCLITLLSQKHLGLLIVENKDSLITSAMF